MLYISSILKMALHGGREGLSRPPCTPIPHPFPPTMGGASAALGSGWGGLKESKELLVPASATPWVGCRGGVFL